SMVASPTAPSSSGAAAKPALDMASMTARWFAAASGSRERRSKTTFEPPSGVRRATRSGAAGASPRGSNRASVPAGSRRAATSEAGSTSIGDRRRGRFRAPAGQPGSDRGRFAGSPGASASRLAGGAKVRAAATDDRPRDGCAAGVAGLPVAAKDLDEHVLRALVALAIDVVPEAGATVFDAAFEHRPGGSVEAFRGGRRDPTGRGVG